MHNTLNTPQAQTRRGQPTKAAAPTAQKPQPQDTFFTPIGNTKPYFKAAFEGFAGSGKTYTAALVAIGLHKKIQSKKPVVIFDT